MRRLYDGIDRAALRVESRPLGLEKAWRLGVGATDESIQRKLASDRVLFGFAGGSESFGLCDSLQSLFACSRGTGSFDEGGESARCRGLWADLNEYPLARRVEVWRARLPIL